MAFQAFLILALLPMSFGISVIFLFRRELLPLHPMELPGLSYGLGLLIWSWVALLGYLLKLPLESSAIHGTLLTVGILVIGYFRPNSDTARRFVKPAPSDWMIVVVILVFGVFAYLTGASPHPTADTVQHLAYVRKFIDTGLFDPNHLQLSATYPQDVLFSVYSYNSVHPLYAVSAMLGGADPYHLVRFGSVVLGPIFLLSVFSAAYRISNRPLVGVLAVLVLIGYWQIELSPLGYGVLGVRNLTYPNHVAIIPALTIIALVWSKLEQNSGSASFFLFLGILAGALPLVHVQWWAYAMFATGVMVPVLWWTVKPLPIRRIVMFTVSFLIASAFVMLIKLSSYTATSSFVEGFNFNAKITIEIDDLFMFHPGKMLQGPQFFFVLLSVFYLGRRLIKKSDGKTNIGANAGEYLAALIILIVLFLSNPITVPLFTKLVPSVILARMLWMLSLAGCLLTAHFLFAISEKYHLIQWSTSLAKGQRALLMIAPVLFVVLAIFAVPQSGMNIERYRDKDAYYYNKGHSPTLDEAYSSQKFRTLLNKIPIGKVVLSAGRYGKEMEAAFRHMSMTYPVYRHLPEARKISEQIDVLLENDTKPDDIIAQLAKIPADYLLLWPRKSEQLALKFNALPKIFKKITDIKIQEFNSKNKRFVLYRIDRGEI